MQFLGMHKRQFNEFWFSGAGCSVLPDKLDSIKVIRAEHQWRRQGSEGEIETPKIKIRWSWNGSL